MKPANSLSRCSHIRLAALTLRCGGVSARIEIEAGAADAGARRSSAPDRVDRLPAPLDVRLRRPPPAEPLGDGGNDLLPVLRRQPVAQPVEPLCHLAPEAKMILRVDGRAAEKRDVLLARPAIDPHSLDQHGREPRPLIVELAMPMVERLRAMDLPPDKHDEP